jgi:hypothetical protein
MTEFSYWRVHDDVDSELIGAKYQRAPKKAPSVVHDKPHAGIVTKDGKPISLSFADGERMDATCLIEKGYYPSKQIACGVYGCVYETLGNKVVVKVGIIEGYEIMLAVYASLLGIGPQIYNAFSCEFKISPKHKTKQKGSVYVMQKLGPSVGAIIDDKKFTQRHADMLLSLAKTCIAEGMVHDDLHLNNILTVIDEKGTIVKLAIIDWGFAGRTVAKIYNYFDSHKNDPSAHHYVKSSTLRRNIFQWSRAFSWLPDEFKFVDEAFDDPANKNPFVKFAQENYADIKIITESLKETSDSRPYMRNFILENRTFGGKSKLDSIDINAELEIYYDEVLRMNQPTREALKKDIFDVNDEIILKTQQQSHLWMGLSIIFG